MQTTRKLTMDELGRMNRDEYLSSEKFRLTLILDNVRSLHNIGSIFRSADAFRIERIILTGISTPPPHREIHKSALGAELSVPWEYLENATSAAHKVLDEGYTLMALEQTSSSIPLGQLSQNKPPLPLALVFGHEVQGVSQDVINLCHLCVEIPQFGTKHSFNVAVSTGIVLWEMSRIYNWQ